MLRARFLSEVPLLPAAARPDQWKAERQVFAVSVNGVDQYPLFQFTADDQPLPAMRDILQIFADLSAWQIALWFFSPNAWLGYEPPMNVLQHDPQAVICAAQYAVEPLEV